jgi:hypothetical protein
MIEHSGTVKPSDLKPVVKFKLRLLGVVDEIPDVS